MDTTALIVGTFAWMQQCVIKAHAAALMRESFDPNPGSRVSVHVMA